VNSVLEEDGGEFTLTSPEQLAAVRATVRAVDWNDSIIHCYAVPPASDGNDPYSPAFNSIWVVWSKTSRQMVLIVVIAADATGKAQTKYIANEFGMQFQSITGYLYTPLTETVNSPLYCHPTTQWTTAIHSSTSGSGTKVTRRRRTHTSRLPPRLLAPRMPRSRLLLSMLPPKSSTCSSLLMLGRGH